MQGQEDNKTDYNNNDNHTNAKEDDDEGKENA